MSGSKTGTQGWIAPEILTDRYTIKVDIFPLGCVFCYALTGGKHPYGNAVERYAKKESGKYELPGELNQNAADLIKTMLNQFRSPGRDNRCTKESLQAYCENARRDAEE